VKSAVQIASDVRAAPDRAAEAESLALEAIRARNEELHVFLYVDEEGAREAAPEWTSRCPGDDAGPLAGVPIAMKDNMCQRRHTHDVRSRILEGWRSALQRDGDHRLLAAGAVPVGKTNLDEFAMGSSTENSAFGPTRNPL
jgi:aspartyl-tRNA(Asn)/glutamyl-tRNA(Gln) amidotransferase subunit A